MKEVLVATTNEGKYLEIASVLEKYGIKAVSPVDLGIFIEVEETGDTLEENASLKAEAYARLAPEQIVIADDTGLEIYALGNEPGIHVRRWKDKKTSMGDKEIISYCLERLSGVPREKRGARFRTVAALLIPNSGIEFFDGRTEGTILEKPGEGIVKGLPFEYLFYVDEAGALLGETKKQSGGGRKHSTHREKAVAKAAERLKKLKTGN